MSLEHMTSRGRIRFADQASRTGSVRLLQDPETRSGILERVSSTILEKKIAREVFKEASLSLAQDIKNRSLSHIDSNAVPSLDLTHKLSVPEVGVVYLTSGDRVSSVSWPALVSERNHDSIGRASLNIDLATGLVDASLRVEKWMRGDQDVTPKDILNKRPRLKLAIGLTELEDLSLLVNSPGTFIERGKFPIDPTEAA